MTHQRLPKIIKAMRHMIPQRIQNHLLDLLRIISPKSLLHRGHVHADFGQTVELMEETDVVDFSSGSVFAWGKVEGSGIGDDYEAVSEGHHGGPGFVGFL